MRVADDRTVALACTICMLLSWDCRCRRGVQLYRWDLRRCLVTLDYRLIFVWLAGLEQSIRP